MKLSKEFEVVCRLGVCLCDLMYASVENVYVGEESGMMYMCNGRTCQEDVSIQNHRQAIPRQHHTVVQK